MNDDIFRCEAANKDGTRCKNEGDEWRQDRDGIPYLVCSRHKKTWNGPYEDRAPQRTN